MNATELYFAGTAGAATALLFVISGHLRAIRTALVPAAAPPVPVAPDAPRMGMHSLAGVVRSDQYAGHPYKVHGDGAVVALHGDSFATWRNEAEFHAWADRQPVATTP